MRSKVCTIYPSVFRKPEVKKDCSRLHEELFWFMLTKLITIMSLAVRLITTTAF